MQCRCKAITTLIFWQAFQMQWRNLYLLLQGTSVEPLFSSRAIRRSPYATQWSMVWALEIWERAHTFKCIHGLGRRLWPHRAHFSIQRGLCAARNCVNSNVNFTERKQWMHRGFQVVTWLVTVRMLVARPNLTGNELANFSSLFLKSKVNAVQYSP